MVYASGKENELSTHACARTRQLTKTVDLKIFRRGERANTKERQAKHSNCELKQITEMILQKRRNNDSGSFGS